MIFNILWLISISAIEGDRNVDHRSLRSGNLQALQPVNYYGNYPSKVETISYPRDKKKIIIINPPKTGTKGFILLNTTITTMMIMKVMKQVNKPLNYASLI